MRRKIQLEEDDLIIERLRFPAPLWGSSIRNALQEVARNLSYSYKEDEMFEPSRYCIQFCGVYAHEHMRFEVTQTHSLEKYINTSKEYRGLIITHEKSMSCIPSTHDNIINALQKTKKALEAKLYR